MAVVHTTGSSSAFQVIPSPGFPVSFTLYGHGNRLSFFMKTVFSRASQRGWPFSGREHPDCPRPGSNALREELIRNRMF